MYENMKNLPIKNGQRHGCINEVANSVPDDAFKRFAEKDREAMKKKKDHESKIVKAKYINYRGPNEILETQYMHWAGEPITSWRFIHDQEYEIPMGLVEQVNDPHKRLPRRSDVLDAKGMPTAKEGAAEQIHAMIPVAF